MRRWWWRGHGSCGLPEVEDALREPLGDDFAVAFVDLDADRLAALVLRCAQCGTRPGEGVEDRVAWVGEQTDPVGDHGEGFRGGVLASLLLRSVPVAVLPAAVPNGTAVGAVEVGDRLPSGRGTVTTD